MYAYAQKKIVTKVSFLNLKKSSLKVFMAAPLQSSLGLNRPELNKNLSEAFSCQLKSKTIEKSMFVKNKCFKGLVG